MYDQYNPSEIHLPHGLQSTQANHDGLVPPIRSNRSEINAQTSSDLGYVGDLGLSVHDGSNASQIDIDPAEFDPNDDIPLSADIRDIEEAEIYNANDLSNKEINTLTQIYGKNKVDSWLTLIDTFELIEYNQKDLPTYKGKQLLISFLKKALSFTKLDQHYNNDDVKVFFKVTIEQILDAIFDGDKITKDNILLEIYGTHEFCPSSVVQLIVYKSKELHKEGDGINEEAYQHIIDREAIHSFLKSKLISKFLKGDKLEQLNGLVHGLFGENIEFDQSFPFSIIGTRFRLPIFSHYPQFAIETISGDDEDRIKLREAYLKYICKETNGILDKDNNGSFILDHAKIEAIIAIDRSISGGLSDREKIRIQLASKFKETLEKKITESKLFCYGTDLENEKWLQTDDRTHEFTIALFRLDDHELNNFFNEQIDNMNLEVEEAAKKGKFKQIENDIYRAAISKSSRLDLSYYDITNEEIAPILELIITNLKSLRVLDLSNNLLESIPPNIMQLEHLEVLKINNNLLNVAPKSLEGHNHIRLIEYYNNPTLCQESIQWFNDFKNKNNESKKTQIPQLDISAVRFTLVNPELRDLRNGTNNNIGDLTPNQQRSNTRSNSKLST